MKISVVRLAIGCLMIVARLAYADPGAVWGVIVRPWVRSHGASFSEGGKTPTTAIKELDQILSRYHTGANLTESQLAENREIKQQVLHGTFDIRELSRIALGRHWTNLADAERDRFVQLMIDILEQKAILSKEQGQRKVASGTVYSVTYRGDKFIDSIKSRALAKTQVYVRSHEVRVALDYKLRRGDGAWKIYDVIVDGSSLVENYQYQFDGIITKNGYPELVRRMEKKLAEIRSEKVP